MTRRRRGTSNGNASGSAAARRRRKAWLIETYRADVDVLELTSDSAPTQSMLIYVDVPVDMALVPGDVDVMTRKPACRCSRCGTVLTAETLIVDRIIPGCDGGTYRRNNIRPECSECSSKRGGATRRKDKK